MTVYYSELLYTLYAVYADVAEHSMHVASNILYRMVTFIAGSLYGTKDAKHAIPAEGYPSI